MINKPDVYVMGGSTKGLSLKYWEAWVDALNNDERGEKPDITIKGAYTHEGWFRRCVDVRSNTVAGIPWEIVPLRGDQPVAMSGEAMPGPWEWFDAEDYLYRVAGSMTLAGGAYAQKEGRLNADMGFTNLDQIEGLKVYNPFTIAVEYEKKNARVQIEPGVFSEKYVGPDDFGNFTHFKRSIQDGTKKTREFYIDSRSVVHTFTPDPFTEQGPGAAVANAARMQAQLLHDLSEFSSEQLRSGLVKKHVFVADKDARQPGEDQLKKWQRWIQRYILGAKGTPPEVMQGLDVKEIGSDLSDLHSEVLTKDAREAVATAFGIPHSLVMSNAANFATAHADQLNFYITTVLPQARAIAHALNRQLFRPLGFRFVFRPDKLEVFQAVELEKAQGLISLTGGKPIMTQDEARADVELDPLGYDNLDAVRMQDVKNWRKKIDRAGRGVAFDPLGLSDSEASVIRERLAAGKSLDAAFSPPFVGF